MAEDGSTARGSVDDFETTAHALVSGMEERGWELSAVPEVARAALGDTPDDVLKVLEFAATEVVPRLNATTDEMSATLHALNGGYVPAGPSGSPLRGLINVLPTGRNFYSVDPKGVPSRLAWETGHAIADSLVERYLAPLREIEEANGKGYVASQLWKDEMLSDGYGWQYNVNLRSIDESRALFYHVNDRILKLLRSRVNGATGDTKAHYQSLIYVIERSLYPSQN